MGFNTYPDKRVSAWLSAYTASARMAVQLDLERSQPRSPCLGGCVLEWGAREPSVICVALDFLFSGVAWGGSLGHIAGAPTPGAALP